MRDLLALGLVLRERFTFEDLERTPEPCADMSDRAQVEEFHAAGQSALLPVYLFNTLNIHRLTPHGGTVLDLGSGSGQMLAYLAKCRPDLTIVGIDLSEPMVNLGNSALRERGLSSRVRLEVGDMADFRSILPRDVAIVTSIFALHHLPTVAMLEQCLDQIAKVTRSHKAAVWLFDHCRPKRAKTALRFPEIFSSEAGTAFKLDSRNSLVASWRFDELTSAAGRILGARLESRRARILPLYQVHWVQHAAPLRAGLLECCSDDKTAREARKLARLFTGLP